MNEEVEFHSDEFHSTLATELAALGAPPLGDLVGQATRRGRRQRRWRTGAALAGSVAAVGVTAALLVGTLGAAGGNGKQPNELAAAAGPSAAASPGTAGSAAASTTPGPAGSASASAAGSAAPSATPSADPGPLVEASPAGLLAAVLNSLPDGVTTDHYAANPKRTLPDGSVLTPAVRTFVNTPSGTGQIIVTAYKDDPDNPLNCKPSPKGSPFVDTCLQDAKGNLVQVETNSTNCIQATAITVRRADGVDVRIDIGSCLASDSGKNPPAVPALTQDQAVALADNPAIGLTMPKAFVEGADAKYPNLPTM
ncbi:hypothetical protein [Kitasatospora azatica]|uniref:hypothetical protein n=1 Tax=Kitasatospora azatica TaxID=58347 RepID=UPI00056B47B4|nr:hypothetical protein [Kitasatospora azatica]